MTPGMKFLASPEIIGRVNKSLTPKLTLRPQHKAFKPK
jgi:hypothetical protein